MNKYRYLIENVLVFALGSVLSKVVSFLLLAVFTKYLSTQEYGDAELIITTISLLIPVFTLSISDASLRFLFGKDSKRSIVSSGLFVTCAGSILLAILSPIGLFFDGFKQYLPIIVMLFIFNSLEVLFFNLCKGFERVKLCALNSLVSVTVLSFTSYLFIVYMGLGICGYLLSIVSSHIACCIYLFVFGKLYLYVNYKDIDYELTKQMLRYSIPFVPSTIAWWINSLSDRYLIVLLLGSSLNGLYSAAAKIPNIISIFTTVFHQAWQLSGIKEYEDCSYSHFFSKVYNAFSSSILISGGFLLMLLPYISKFLFKGDFSEAWLYVPFLILGAIFSGLCGVLAPAYMAAKKTGTLMASTLAGAAVNIILNICLLSIVGLQAASISTFISFVIVWVIRFYMLKPIVHIKIEWITFCISIILLLIESVLLIENYSYTWVCSTLLIICLLNVRSILSCVNVITNRYK